MWLLNVGRLLGVRVTGAAYLYKKSQDNKPFSLAFLDCNLTPVSKVCEAVPISMFWAPYGISELPEVHFEFPFNLIGKLTMVFFNRSIMVRSQILVRRQGPRTRILALFHRQT